jgi:carbon storage regulator
MNVNLRRRDIMLVLSRKRGEKIVLPELGIELMVVEISGDRVRLGVAAPADIAVFREEIWERILKEQQAAGQATPVKGARTLAAGHGSGR